MKKENKIDYEKVEIELENNEDTVSNLADRIFGSVEDLTKDRYGENRYDYNDALIKERAIFYKEGLRFMNELSLFLIKKDLE